MAEQPILVPVTTRALIQRINRVLAKRDEQLRATRGARARLDLGDFYVHELRRNLALETRVDPEEFGRELGVLKPWERVVED